MLTYNGLVQHIRLALGGQPSVVSGVTQAQRIAEIVNQAGNYLFTKQWRFRERTSRPISIVASQDWAAMPSDIEEIVSLTCRSGLGWRVELTTPERMEELRANNTSWSADGIYSACLSRPWAQTGTTTPLVDGSGMPAVRLELFPTPNTTSSDVLTVRYMGLWVAVSDATESGYQIPVPAYVESLLIAYARAFALAYEDEGLSARLLEIDMGPLFSAAAIKDGIQQRDYGRLPSTVGFFRARSAALEAGLGGVVGTPASATSNIRWRGTYSPSSSYVVGDVVRHLSTVYICVTDVSGVDPPASQWDVVVTDGATGPIGLPATGSLDYAYQQLTLAPITISTASFWTGVLDLFSLPAGTWMIWGQAAVSSTTSQPTVDLRILDSTTSTTVAVSTSILARAPIAEHIAVFGVYESPSAFTLSLQVAASTNTTTVQSHSGAMGLAGATALMAVHL